MNNKLKNLPHVYYVNLDQRTDRRRFMEAQFKENGITNYTRVSGSKYLVSEKDNWKHLVIGDIGNSYSYAVAHAITHFEFFKDWLNNTDDEYLILMEDDYDLGIIQYWHFDWDYLMSRLPYDWDCIMLGFESPSVIPFYLHPLNYEYSLGPCLLNRDYVQKLVDLHCVGDKYKLDNNICNGIWKNLKGYKTVSGTGDYFICQNGKTYCLPLIPLNPYFGSFESNTWLPRPHMQICLDTYYDWWKYERDNYTLDEFFTYDKPNDEYMQRELLNCDPKYFFNKLIIQRQNVLTKYE